MWLWLSVLSAQESSRFKPFLMALVCQKCASTSLLYPSTWVRSWRGTLPSNHKRSVCTRASGVARISKKRGRGVNKKPYINKVHIIILYHYYCVQSCPSFTLNLQEKAVFFYIVISAKIRPIVEGNVFFALPLPTDYANDRNVYYKKMIHIILIYYSFHAFCSYQAKNRNRIKRLGVILHVGNRQPAGTRIFRTIRFSHRRVDILIASDFVNFFFHEYYSNFVT